MIDRMLSHYETPSPLRAWNPAVKAFTLLIVSLLLTAIFDPITPLALLVASLLVTRVFGRVSTAGLLAGLVPALALAAGLTWTNAVFARPGAEVWWRWGPFVASPAGLTVGVSLGLRVLCFASYSLMFLATTDPTEFVLSLITNLRVPHQFGYAMLAVYRFLPTLASEYVLIRGAHRVRGVGEREGLGGRLRRGFRYTVPLLASAIRRAERVAIAMEARGLEAGSPRTYYRRPPLRAGDLLAAVALVAVNLLIVLACWRLGFLRLWRGQLY